MEEHWNQKDRSDTNLLNYGLATCPMTLMVKDHKTWSVESGKPPPTRSIMGGNVGGNKGLSEFMSLVLEPVAKKMDSMETNATNGLLSVIEELNKDLTKRKEKEGNPSNHQEEPPTHLEEPSSHQEGSADSGEMEVEQVRLDPVVEKHEHAESEPRSSQQEERTRILDNNIKPKRGERTAWMREKMTVIRKKQEYHAKKQQVNMKMKDRRRKTQGWTPKGNRILESWEVSEKNKIQDESDLVVVGADVAALYPSLNDIEVAIIIFNAIMNSDIKFLNFNFKVASAYIAMHMTPEEVERSPLWTILPRRSARGGM